MVIRHMNIALIKPIALVIQWFSPLIKQLIIQRLANGQFVFQLPNIRLFLTCVLMGCIQYICQCKLKGYTQFSILQHNNQWFSFLLGHIQCGQFLHIQWFFFHEVLFQSFAQLHIQYKPRFKKKKMFNIKS